jgi:hypothetical protein
LGTVFWWRAFPVFSPGVHEAALTHGDREQASPGKVGGGGREALPSSNTIETFTLKNGIIWSRFDLSVLPLTDTETSQ